LSSDGLLLTVSEILGGEEEHSQYSDGINGYILIGMSRRDISVGTCGSIDDQSHQTTY
jgi:hypothetical protein